MSELELKIGYSFYKPEYLRIALTHKSFFNESKEKQPGHNERLEFLGDAVLDLVLSDILMKRFPGESEGRLSKKRASLVNEGVLAGLARNLDLDKCLLLGKGERISKSQNNARLQASVFEALIGAVFLDGGYAKSYYLIDQLFVDLISTISVGVDFEGDFKTRFQEYCQYKWKLTPTYELVGEEGPPHNKIFKVAVKKGDLILAEGVGPSKKEAEQSAACAALQKEKENGQ